VVAAAVVALLACLLVNLDALEPERLATQMRGFGALTPAVFMLARVLGTVAFAPGSVMAIGAGILFGPWQGAIYNLIGSTAGAVLAFAIARFLAPDWIARHVVRRKRLGRFIRGVESEGWRFVAFVRLVPLFPYNLVNYAFGLSRIGVAPYTLATFVCMIPGDVAFVYLGYAGREVAAGNGAAVYGALAALAVLATLAVVPRLVRQYRVTADPDADADEAQDGL